MSYEEIENVIAYSAIIHRKFDLMTILERKRQVIKATGFMDFLEVLPIETLGGLELFKSYFKSRIEPFKNPDSVKPKIKSVLLVGFQGTGKSHAVKCLCSLLGWPGIMLDIGGLKGSLVGETEKNTRLATKTIDAFGKCVVAIDEIEKAFGGTGKGQAHETSEGILGHFLTWMQERTSDAVLIATANNLDVLPPEFLRAGGRWDAIFFVNLPNPDEVKHIIEIKNGQYKSNVPTDKSFCKRLYQEKWSGAEIEQLAKDSHYEDDIENAMRQIPILAQYREKELQSIKEKASIYRHANNNVKIVKRNGKKRKLALK
jgi:SpoVK/Ycf46/Vps4 family AAA+-type ATPase